MTSRSNGGCAAEARAYHSAVSFLGLASQHCCLLCALSLSPIPIPFSERLEASGPRNGGIAGRSESNLSLVAPESWLPVPIFQNPEEIGVGMAAACAPIGLVPLDAMVLWPGGSGKLHLL